MLMGGSVYIRVDGARLSSAIRPSSARYTLRLLGDPAADLRAAEYRSHCRSQDHTYEPIGGVVACRSSLDRRTVMPHSHVSTFAVIIV